MWRHGFGLPLKARPDQRVSWAFPIASGDATSLWDRKIRPQSFAFGTRRMGQMVLDQELQVKDAIRSSLQHLVAIYDHGVSMILRDGRLLSPVLDLRETNFILGLGPGSRGPCGRRGSAGPSHSLARFCHV